MNHCALNVAIYAGRGKHWAMTERGRAAVTRTATAFSVGRSHLAWDGDALTIHIDEVANPWPTRLRGRVRVSSGALSRETYLLDPAGAHRWRPVAPCARVEVAFTQPAMRWLGEGYFDINDGDAPLERDFASWEWSRASLRDGAVVSYDCTMRDGARRDLALRFDRAGRAERIEPLAQTKLPRTGWRIARSARADQGSSATVARTFEDTPFYARSLLASQILGERAAVMHESLSLERFRKPIVQAMLPFRMPRR